LIIGGQLSGNLSFGEKKKHKIKDTRNSLEVLDDQLIIEHSKYTEMDANKKSNIKYLFDEFKYQQYYSVRVIEQAIANFEMVIDIALQIQKYGDE
jgi:predicted transcriptional regulator